MSTILEALRKSERARREGKTPVYGNASEPVAPSLLGWSTILAGIALLFALIAIVWVLQRRPPEIATAAESTGTAPEPAAAVVAVPPAVEVPSPVVQMKSAPIDVKAKPEIRPKVKERSEMAASASLPAAVNRKPVTSPPHNSDVTLWSSLPEAERAGLPPLRVNIHVYTPDESQRILYIDNEPRVRGEVISPGITVEDIVPEGAIVRYRNKRYLLPRPT